MYPIDYTLTLVTDAPERYARGLRTGVVAATDPIARALCVTKPHRL